MSEGSTLSACSAWIGSHPAATPPGCDAVSHVTLTNFRSYRTLRLDLDRRPVVLTGANGAGKTNLLEALSFLSPGRGLRRARLDEVTCDSVKRPAANPVCWAVTATVDGPNGSARVSTGVEVAGHPDEARRTARIDGLPVTNLAALDQALSIVWLTPELDRLFTDGASARRHFLDRLVGSVDPQHSGRVNSYQRAMRERAGLLRNERNCSRAADADWLAALERRMAETGIALAAARREFVRQLSEICERGLEPFPAAQIAVSGQVETWLDNSPALQAEDRMRDTLAAGRDRDREAGRALTGPHRSDLEVVHLNRMQPAARCSTGEQKSLLVAITLAHTRLVASHRNAVPLLLLDEVAAHLDVDLRLALFSEICATGAQAWMTGTDHSLFRPFRERAQYFRVEDAGVRCAGDQQ